MDIEAMRCHANDKNMPFGFRYQSQMGTHQIGQTENHMCVCRTETEGAWEKEEKEEEEKRGKKFY